MIPPPVQPHGYLPPGIHPATWQEVAQRFSTNPHRIALLNGLQAAASNLAGAGCVELILDGSFVSEKIVPSDYDGCWDPTHVDPALVDPVLLDFRERRKAMKRKYMGELFLSSSHAAPGIAFRDFFLTDRNGVPKGVLLIDLRTIP